MSLRDDLIEDEGMILHCYDDHLGFKTIGIGRLIDKRRGGGISEEEALYLLDNDIRRVSLDLNARLPWLRLQPEPVRRALMNMAFQLGVSGLLKFRKMLAALEVGNIDEACLQAYQSRWAKQTPARAARVTRLFKENEHGKRPR